MDEHEEEKRIPEDKGGEGAAGQEEIDPKVQSYNRLRYLLSN